MSYNPPQTLPRAPTHLGKAWLQLSVPQVAWAYAFWWAGVGDLSCLLSGGARQDAHA